MDVARDTDSQALALLQRRDLRGFDLAYATYASRIRAFILRLSGRSDTADDILQEVFLRLAERGPELRRDSNLRAWLFTVARNAFLSRARILEPTGSECELESQPSQAVDTEARLLLTDVERALRSLRQEDRELLLLVGVEGMEPAEVGRVLNIDAATIRQRLARARSRLQVALERTPNPTSSEELVMK